MPTIQTLQKDADIFLALQVELGRQLRPDDPILECTCCGLVYWQSEQSEYLGMSGIIGCPGCGCDEVWDLTEGETG